VKAAEARGIPWLRLNDQSLVQLGHGKYQQRIQATGHRPARRTSPSSSRATRRKPTRSSATLGLPVPKQELVQSEGQAVRAANRIGYPVVTKPYNGNHGRGISIRLMTDEEVKQGFAVAREHSRSIIVETYSRVTITACWSSTANSSRPRGARPGTSWVTASTLSRSSSNS